MFMKTVALAVAGSSVAMAVGLTSDSLTSFVDVLDLGSSFNPVKPSYWTGLPHHRRTPFAVSPDGSTAFLAYLDSSLTDVHVIEVDPTTFTAKGSAVTITGGMEGMRLRTSSWFERSLIMPYSWWPRCPERRLRSFDKCRCYWH